MKIVRKEESRELCTEAGWYAYDYELDRAMKREDIERLRELGENLIYLSSLKAPFYKLECRYLMMKGVEGRTSFRLAVYKEYEEELCKKVETFLENLCVGV